jgi:multicomponent Na+:H+ antiporter subunit G
MSLDDWLDLAAAAALVLGALFALTASIGIIRFPDVPSRLHAATKPQIFGLMLVVLAIALADRSWATLLALVPVIVLQMLTAPVSAHMVGRAGYRTGNFEPETLVEDDLEAAVDRASRETGDE